MPAVKSTKKDTKKTTTKPKAAPKAAPKASPKAAAKAAPKEKEAAGSKRKRVQFSAAHEGPSKKKANSPAKKILKKAPVEEELESSEEESEEEEKTVVEEKNDEDDEELTEEQEAAFRKEILGDIASSEGEDSSDDEDKIDKNEDVVTLDSKKLEKSMTETKKTFEKKAAKSTKEQTEEAGVVYVGRIPHGFYEKEMKGYFSQFGDILRLRLSRNKKTGKSKHYAFIEFASEAVAEIVAETMNNYLLFGHMLQCKVIPAEKVHEKLFAGANSVYKPFNYELRNRQLLNKPKTAEKLEAKREALKKTEQKLRKQIKEAGIDYDFPSFS